MRPLLLDLFCGEGGAAAGYAVAGFDVVGVDSDPVRLRRYPFPWILGDALDVLRDLLAGEVLWASDGGVVSLGLLAAAHASPPCQGYSDLRYLTGREYPRLVEAVRDLLDATGLRWVIENVPGSPVRNPVTLCGSEFGLGATGPDGVFRQLRRHRLFEANFWLWGAGGCRHVGQPVGVYGHGGGGAMSRGYKGALAESRQAIGAPWMSRQGVSLSIPPAYAEHVGVQLVDQLGRVAA